MEVMLHEVSRWLKSQHSVSAPNDWLEACVDWISSEHGNQLARDRNTLHNLVLEQWLLSDLKEIGAQCLPRNLPQEKKYMLNGSFCLQINSVVDVSGSYYSQLQKVQGTENENVHVSATQYNKDDHIKSGRMLMMDMTDGAIDIKAMEYKPIRDLNTNVKLGTKVIISGNVLCRLGVLMLSGNNVKIIGGEVDGLSTTQEETLSQALQFKERFKEEPSNQQFKGQGKTYRKVKNSMDKSLNSGVMKSSGKPIKEEITTNQQPFKKEMSTNQQATQGFKEAMEVDWEEDMDDLLLKHSVTEEQQVQPVVRSTMQKQSINQNTSKSAHNNDRQPIVSSNQAIETFTDDDFEVEDFHSVQQELSFKQSTTRCFLQNNDAIQADNRANSTRPTTGELRKIMPSTKRTSEHFIDDEDFDFDQEELEQLEKVIKREHQHFTSSSASSAVSQEEIKVQRQTTRSELPVEVHSSVNIPVSNAPSGTLPSMKHERKSFWDNSNTTSMHKDKSDASVKTEYEGIDQKYTVINNKAKPHNLERNLVNRKNFMNVKCEALCIKPKQEMPSVTPEPINVTPEMFTGKFKYLIEVNSMKQSAIKQKVRTKAYISTLSGKLEFNDGHFWSLPLLLNDGSSLTSVVVSDSVLCQLIGFKASDCGRVKQQGSRQEKLKMAEGLKKCQQRLIEMSCLMDIELGGDLQTPVIVGLTAMDDVEKNLFEY